MNDRPAEPTPAEDATGLASARTSRRALGGVLGLGAALPVLAACTVGSSSGSESDSGSGGGEDSGGGDSGSGGDSGLSVPASEVPSGGGVILDEEELVLTQPSDGEYRAFSGICTHQGCLVSQVTPDGIQCSCHNSLFSLEDGSVLSGPADGPLAERSVTVDGEDLTVT